MKFTPRTALAACAAAMTVAVTLPTSPAYAINAVPCPSGINNFVEIKNHNGSHTDSHCYANEGTKHVELYGVHFIAAGNNNVLINYIKHEGGGTDSRKFRKNEGAFFDSLHLVYEIRILPDNG